MRTKTRARRGRRWPARNEYGSFTFLEGTEGDSTIIGALASLINEHSSAIETLEKQVAELKKRGAGE